MRRMILPILKKYWKLLLSAMLVSALGCGIMVGMSSAYISLDGSLADYVRDYRYPSAVITTEVVNRSRIESLASIPGVTAVDARLCGDTYMIDTRGRYLSVRVFSCNEGDLQRFHVWEEAEAGDRDSVRLEYNFAVDNGRSSRPATRSASALVKNTACISSRRLYPRRRRSACRSRTIPGA